LGQIHRAYFAAETLFVSQIVRRFHVQTPRLGARTGRTLASLIAGSPISTRRAQTRAPAGRAQSRREPSQSRRADLSRSHYSWCAAVTATGNLHAGDHSEVPTHDSAAALSREQANGHHAQKLAIVKEAMTDGTVTERDAQMLALKHEGHTDAQIAAKVGVAQQTVSNRIATARKKVREKWQVRVTQLAALALAVVLGFFVWRKREEVANFFRGPTPGPAPAPTQTAPPTPEPSTPVARAAELRRQAAEACEQEDYKTCSDRLEEAANLDPAGDKEPSVRELRHQVEDHVRFERPNEAKPGYPR
jgi:DNA-directed RNA polymerase specialized sigma24 family protein